MPLDEPPQSAKVGPSPVQPLSDSESGQHLPVLLRLLLLLRRVPPFNVVGFVIVAASFLPVLGICRLLGEGRDAVVFAIGGPIGLTLDLGYRLQFSKGDLIHPNLGGKFLWLPLWWVAIFWCVYGLWQSFTGAT